MSKGLVAGSWLLGSGNHENLQPVPKNQKLVL